MKQIGYLLIILIGLSLCVGCDKSQSLIADSTPTLESQVVTNEPMEAIPSAAPSQIPQATPTMFTNLLSLPDPGTISAHGMLIVIDPFSAIPDANDAIYLVPLASVDQNISAIPPVGSEGTIQAEVDEGTGEFLFTGIKPGQYVVVVKEKSGVELPSRLLGSESMAIFTFSETDRDKTIDLGYLQFP